MLVGSKSFTRRYHQSWLHGDTGLLQAATGTQAGFKGFTCTERRFGANDIFTDAVRDGKHAGPSVDVPSEEVRDEASLPSMDRRGLPASGLPLS